MKFGKRLERFKNTVLKLLAGELALAQEAHELNRAIFLTTKMQNALSIFKERIESEAIALKQEMEERGLDFSKQLETNFSSSLQAQYLDVQQILNALDEDHMAVHLNIIQITNQLLSYEHSNLQEQAAAHAMNFSHHNPEPGPDNADVSGACGFTPSSY